mgnify:FL=1
MVVYSRTEIKVKNKGEHKMKKLIFAGKCHGVGISHVVRDCDFTESTGFFRNEYQMYYILEGERLFYIGRKGYKMTKGTVAFVDKKQIPITNVIGDQFHNRILIELEEDWLIKAGEILEMDFPKVFEEFHGVLQISSVLQKEMEEKINKIEKISGGELQGKDAAEVKLIILDMIQMIIRGEWKRQEEYGLPEGKMFRYIKAREITNYLIEHCCEVYGLRDVADIFYMDKSYLSRIFKEATNFTVNEFINCQRIGKAREMLLKENLTIEEISRRLGYESLPYFDRVFKKYTGFTPLQYRKTRKNMDKNEKLKGKER